MLQDVTLLLPEWEDGHFYLAKYYDKLMPMVTDNKMEKQGDLIRYIVHHFGRLDNRKIMIMYFGYTFLQQLRLTPNFTQQ